ncbi:hypothetical protein LCGC14_1807640 [marine sediment metagenome]|uniref:Uncharacterized protein n=1 Tax=marine sediment metagenome TaxID=412755 RepID=A0A0F9E437_9ZZZZ
MEELFKFLRGRKSFIIAGLVLVLGGLQGLDIFTMPEYVWPVLAGAFGLALRAGVNKVAEEIKSK